MLGIVRAMGAHHPDLDQTKESDNRDEPGNEKPPAKPINPRPSEDENGQTDKQETSQIPRAEMAVQRVTHWTIVTTLGNARGKRLSGIQE